MLAGETNQTVGNKDSLARKMKVDSHRCDPHYIVVLCTSCGIGRQVLIDQPNFPSGNLTCPECGKGSLIEEQEDQKCNAKKMLAGEISFKDLVAMCVGFGRPDERCSQEVVKYLLETRSVVEADVMGPQGRVSLYYLKLSDGSVIHFSGVAYKVRYERKEKEDGQQRDKDSVPPGGA